MKRLLLLGGSRYILPIIETAHNIGCYVITCDYLPNNIAHRFSDEYCNVSIIDKEAVLEVAKKHNIDGIMSFACDPGVVTAAFVAEKLSLPSCGPYKSVEILQNKGLFRRFLAEHGFNVPTAKGYTSIREALKDHDRFHWPVIVKPVDSAGSKGVIKVENENYEKLRESIEYAVSFSHSKEFIIEDFLMQKGNSSDSDCFSVDGQLRFVSFNSQRFDIYAENPYTPATYSWPATITEEHQRELTFEIQRLLKLLNMGTSIYNIETRECIDGKAYIMECSPRGGGNRLAEMLYHVTGVDMITNAVRAAIGEPIMDMDQKLSDGAWAEIIIHSKQAGIFEALWVSDVIEKYIIENDLWVMSGMKVGGFSGANDAIGTLVLRFDNQDMLNEVLKNEKEYVRVVLRS